MLSTALLYWLNKLHFTSPIYFTAELTIHFSVNLGSLTSLTYRYQSSWPKSPDPHNLHTRTLVASPPSTDCLPDKRMPYDLPQLDFLYCRTRRMSRTPPYCDNACNENELSNIRLRACRRSDCSENFWNAPIPALNTIPGDVYSRLSQRISGVSDRIKPDGVYLIWIVWKVILDWIIGRFKESREINSCSALSSVRARSRILWK